MDLYPVQIAAGLKELGLEIDAKRVEALAVHLRAVFETNANLNLTSIDPEDAVALHVLDSASALSFLSRAPAGTFADLGSGAGYPGIPLAVLSGRPVALVESVRKKAAFLERIVADLCLKATVHPVRAEDLAGEHGERYAVVTARAVSALPSLVELATPLLAMGGWLVCLKGRPEQEELVRGDRAADACGLERIETADVTVPGVEGARTIVVYRRAGEPRVKLPRRNGLAQRNPLA